MHAKSFCRPARGGRLGLQGYIAGRGSFEISRRPPFSRAPIYYGCGYISRPDFWKPGLIFGAIFLIVLLVIGIPYPASVHI